MSSMEEVIEILQRMQGLPPTEAQRQALRLEDTEPLFSALAVARRLLDHAEVTVDWVAEILDDPQNTGSDWWNATGFADLQATIKAAQVDRIQAELNARRRAIANSRHAAASPPLRHVHRELLTVIIRLQEEQKVIDQIVASYKREKTRHDEQARNSQRAKWSDWITSLFQPPPLSSVETPDTLGEVLSQINRFIANYQIQSSRLWQRLAEMAAVAPGSSASSME
jgi:hypothetical protein